MLALMKKNIISLVTVIAVAAGGYMAYNAISVSPVKITDSAIIKSSTPISADEQSKVDTLSQIRKDTMMKEWLSDHLPIIEDTHEAIKVTINARYYKQDGTLNKLGIDTPEGDHIIMSVTSKPYQVNYKNNEYNVMQSNEGQYYLSVL